MIKLTEKHKLPFCSVKITYRGRSLQIENILIDTGSGGTILKMDLVEQIGITIDVNDTIETISGIGGTEFVYIKSIDSIEIGELNISNFEIEIGAMDYGFNINGIIGMDFLRNTGAIIDLKNMTISN
jgi:predicted aspartyl protease